MATNTRILEVGRCLNFGIEFVYKTTWQICKAEALIEIQETNYSGKVNYWVKFDMLVCYVIGIFMTLKHLSLNYVPIFNI
jgi:hypothetical protein